MFFLLSQICNLGIVGKPICAIDDFLEKVVRPFIVKVHLVHNYTNISGRKLNLREDKGDKSAGEKQ